MYNTIPHKQRGLLYYKFLPVDMIWQTTWHHIPAYRNLKALLDTLKCLITVFTDKYYEYIHSQALCNVQKDDIIWTYRKCQIKIMCFTEACLLLHADETALFARCFLSSIQCQPLISSTTCQTRFFNQLRNSTLQFSDLFLWSKITTMKTLKS